MLDIVIKGGEVMDGLGSRAHNADVGIKDGKIVSMGQLGDEQADRVIRADGLTVAPGFIDTHTHSDFTILVNPRVESSIRQGVTTQVVGLCGHSAAPVNKEKRELLERAVFGHLPGYHLDWESFAEYLNAIEERRVAHNIVPLVGHGAIRIAVMGYDRRQPTRKELSEMEELVDRSMKEGAFGLSTGLSYAPGSNSDTGEIIHLCKVVAKHSGLYVTHLRDYSVGFREATREALEIAEEAGVPLQLAHHRPVYGANMTSEESFRMIDEALDRGLDVTSEMYPYTWGATTMTALLPPRAFEGGAGKLLDRLGDRASREDLKRGMEEPVTGHGYWVKNNLWDKIMLMNSDKNKRFLGKTILQIAKETGKEPQDVVLDILLEEGENAYAVIMAVDASRQEDLDRLFRHKSSMVGSDGMSLAPYGELADVRWHPRAYGCFPRMIAQYYRERKILSLEGVVRKMTSVCARRLGIEDRGVLNPGYRADIVVFDPRRIVDTATYQQPNQYPDGIPYVIVNGVIVVDNGEHTAMLPGKVLRHKHN